MEDNLYDRLAREHGVDRETVKLAMYSWAFKEGGRDRVIYEDFRKHMWIKLPINELLDQLGRKSDAIEKLSAALHDYDNEHHNAMHGVPPRGHLYPTHKEAVDGAHTLMSLRRKQEAARKKRLEADRAVTRPIRPLYPHQKAVLDMIEGESYWDGLHAILSGVGY